MRAILAACLIVLAAPAAFASQCLQLAGDPTGDPTARIWKASLQPGEVRIRFVGHSAFRIETDQGRAAVTDFYGDPGPGPAPDVVTMNHAHSSHWTPHPPDDIAHVLEGWGDGAAPIRHWVQLDDLLIRNVATDIRTWAGGVEKFGNSIFVFEYEGLCIGHLGHLHHQPTETHYAQIGRLDVVLVPVDGGVTMPIEDMLAVMRRVKARVVIPMHIFRPGSLQRFLAGMTGDFEIDLSEENSVTLSATSLPSAPTVKVLSPAVRDGGLWLDD